MLLGGLAYFSMLRYKIIHKIGEGAHGTVFKAKHIENGTICALKRIPVKNWDIPISLLREIKTLEQLQHPNIVRLLEVFGCGTSCVLVFEFLQTDVSQILRNSPRRLSEAHIKSYMWMLLQGIYYCHSNNIIHRDLKPANLLIAKNGVLKLADFGLARIENTARPKSHQVATRWYRAPELLYGARYYDFGIDMWAIGCIFGELLNHSPLFPGSNDIDQLGCVLSNLGTPSLADWPVTTTN